MHYFIENSILIVLNMLQYFLAIIEAKVTSDNDDDNDSVLFQVEINELLLNIVIGYIV